jgi:hypothetical protein
LRARSIKSGKNDENKPKCWKFANNGYLAYHLCAHNLPGPHQANPKNKYLSKMASLYMKWFSRFAKSMSEVTRIFTRKLGKTILVTEIRLSALLPEAAVCYTKLRLHKISLVGKKAM